MNIAFTPEAVAAEVEYRFETGRVHSAWPGSDRRLPPVAGRWLRRVSHRSSTQHRTQRA